MVQAWYIDNDSSDPRLEHHRNPPEYVTVEDLYKKTGVEYFKFNIGPNNKYDERLEELTRKRGYIFVDERVCTKENLTTLEEKFKEFYTEHMHPEEEIRLVEEGSAYFDVRDDTDQWIRIRVTAGDLLVLPAGIYHRFTRDTDERFRLRNFSLDSTVWQAYYRPADDLLPRRKYVEKLRKGFPAAR